MSVISSRYDSDCQTCLSRCQRPSFRVVVSLIALIDVCS